MADPIRKELEALAAGDVLARLAELEKLVKKPKPAKVGKP